MKSQRDLKQLLSRTFTFPGVDILVVEKRLQEILQRHKYKIRRTSGSEKGFFIQALYGTKLVAFLSSILPYGKRLLLRADIKPHPDSVEVCLTIAIRKERDEFTTFKLERIIEAEILEKSFDITAGFDLNRLLSSSWGIIWGDETEVKLRCSPQVTRRVLGCP